MIIKKRFKKFSSEFLDNLLMGKMKENYIYWVEDNNGRRISDDFTYIKKFEYGPFIIMQKTLNLSFAILKDRSNDTLYIEGDLYYWTYCNGDISIHNNQGEGYLVDKDGNILQNNFIVEDHLYDGYLIRQNGLLGYIDFNAQITVKPQFVKIDLSYCYNKDFIGEYEDGSKIHMNIFGETLSANIYIDRMYPFDDNLLYAVENGLMGLIYSNGKVALELKYKDLKGLTLKHDWLKAKKDTGYGIIDIDGNIIKDFVYSEITENISEKKLILKQDTIINLDM